MIPLRNESWLELACELALGRLHAVKTDFILHDPITVERDLRARFKIFAPEARPEVTLHLLQLNKSVSAVGHPAV